MGIVIEDCKKRLAIEKELAIKTGLNHDANVLLVDAIDVAIDTMCKYQKIDDIVNDYYNSNKYEEFMDGEIIELIKFVLNAVYEVEDGNDD